MGNYSKLIAAIVGAIVARWVLKSTGLDFASIGVAAEFNELIAAGVEVVVTTVGAAITAAFVYFFPANKPKAPVDDFRGENV